MDVCTGSFPFTTCLSSKGDDLYAVLVTGEHQFYVREKDQPERRVARICSDEHVNAAPSKKWRVVSR